MNRREGPPPSGRQTSPGAGERHPPRRLSRREALALGGAGVFGFLGVATAADLAAGDPVGRAVAPKRSPTPTPTATTPPVPRAFTVLSRKPGLAVGDIYLTDMGAAAKAIQADDDGATRWSTSGARSYADFRVQSYQGRTVFTWWESDSTGLAAYAAGRDIITDLDHRVIATIETHAGVSPDEHEFLITPRGTALITSYVKTRIDLSRHGGSAKGWVMNGVFEEIDIATGTVLQHWESLDHVDLDESYAGVPDKASEPYDYFHINAVHPTPDGNIIISARHTWTAYKIERKTGRVIWRLGGKRSDYAVPAAARFAWQHDVQFETPGAIRLFDNASDGTKILHRRSRILWLSVDEGHRRVTLQRLLQHPDRVSAAAMGNAQPLPNGNVFVGWGTAKRITEFAPDGRVLFDASLPEVTYRAYRKIQT